MAQELEYKFSLLEDHFPSGEELKLYFTNGFEIGAMTTRQQHDRYFDNADLSLKQANMALRRRTFQGRTLISLKSKGTVEGALHRREEIELPMTTASGYWPEEIRQRIETITAPGNLMTVLEINMHRVYYEVLRTGNVLAHIAFDDVSARHPQRDVSVHFTELEVEAVGNANEKDLEPIVETLQAAIPLNVNSFNKLERAQALLSFYED